MAGGKLAESRLGWHFLSVVRKRQKPLMQSAGLWLAVGIAVCLGLSGCREGGPDLESAEAATRPHVSHFEGVERWARRTMSAAHLRSRDALEETLVAPYRRDRELLGLWVHRIAPLEERISLDRACSENPEVSELFYLRSLDVEWANHRCDGTPAVVVSRMRESPGGEIRVTVAYARDDD